MNLPEIGSDNLINQADKRQEMWLRIGGPIAILLLAVVMAMATWGKWPDVLIDFGRELYVPWRITEGEHPHKDFAYLNGPLSPYFNAMLFRLFGVGLRTLVIANLAILALMLYLIYSLFLKIGGHLAATMAGVLVVLLFAFNQYVNVGNYNYICPYSHEMTHGLLLSFAAICSFGRYLDTAKLRWALLLGFLTGLTFLTKPEFFLAIGAAVTIGLALAAWMQGLTIRRAAALFSVVASGFFAPLLVAIVLLSFYMPIHTSMRSVVGAWPLVIEGRMARMPQYQARMGLDNPARSLQLLGSSTVAYIICFSITVGISRLINWWRKGPDVSTRLKRLMPMALLILAVDVLLFYILAKWWYHAFRPLPVFVGALCVITFMDVFRSRTNWKVGSGLLLRLIFIFFALLLMLKNLLYSRIHHYGFALAMPATILLAMAFVVWFPQWLKLSRELTQAFRASAINVCAIVVLVFLVVSFKNYAQKTHIVGKGADAFLADERGPYVNIAIEQLLEQSEPNDVVVVLPDGWMLNYLTRRVISPSFPALGPLHFKIKGEKAVADQFITTAPEWIVIVPRDCSEFGAQYFGVDFGREFWRQIRQNYQIVYQIGKIPQKERNKGMALLRRKL